MPVKLLDIPRWSCTQRILAHHMNSIFRSQRLFTGGDTCLWSQRISNDHRRGKQQKRVHKRIRKQTIFEELPSFYASSILVIKINCSFENRYVPKILVA